MQREPIHLETIPRENYQSRYGERTGGVPMPVVPEDRIDAALAMARIRMRRGEKDAAKAAIDHAFDPLFTPGAEPITLDSHMEALGLPPDVVGHLDTLGCATVADLLAVSEESLRSLRGVGDRVVEVVKAAQVSLTPRNGCPTI